MRRVVAILACVVSLLPGGARADTVATCEARAKLKWNVCEGSTEAEWHNLTVRYCFGRGAVGTFTGQLSILVRAEHGGYSQIGDGEPQLLVAARGCLEDRIGGSSREGSVGWYVAGRGRGFYSVSVLLDRD